MQRSLLPLLLCALVFSAAQAQSTDHSSMPGMGRVSTSAQSSTDLSTLSGPAFDRAFLSMMIPHHQGAIEMSQAVVNNAKDPQVKTWAQGIIAAQRQEITEMQAWLKGLGGVNSAAQSGMAQDMRGMVAAIKKTPTDHAFVSGMLPHHASAVSMASVALQRSSDPRVLGLARDIIRAQASEMYAFRQWLIKHKG